LRSAGRGWDGRGRRAEAAARRTHRPVRWLGAMVPTGEGLQAPLGRYGDGGVCGRGAADG
jgi:hypothetical protein